MEPLVIIVVPGVLGGLLVAFAIVALHRRREGRAALLVPQRLPVTTDMINMASIKVAGVGGLGLVAMAVAVSLGVRQIGQALGISLALGCVLAIVLIAWRRKTGSLPSADQGFGGNTVLAIDEPPHPGAPDDPGPRPLRLVQPLAPSR